MFSSKTFLRALFAVAFAAATCVLCLRVHDGVETSLWGLVGSRGDKDVVLSLMRGVSSRRNILIDAESVESRDKAVADFSGTGSVDFLRTLKYLGERRFGLLSGRDREELLSGGEETLARRSAKSLFGMVPRLLPVREDPFGLFTDWATSLESSLGDGWSLENGVPMRYRDGRYYALISEDGVVPRGELLSTIEKARSYSGEVRVWCTGAPFHSALQTESSVREVNVLSVLSLVTVIAIGFSLFRSFRFLLPLVTCISFAFIVASAVLFLYSPKPHVLTFLFGTTLVGLGVDYAYHALSGASVKSLLKALVTSIACFLPMMFSGVSILTEMAVFTVTGLASACAFAVGGVPRKIKIVHAEHTLRSVRFSRMVFVVALAVLAVASIGLSKITVSNEPADFYHPEEYLARGERLLAELDGGGDATFTVLSGRSVQEALETEESLGIAGLSAVIPSLKRQRENATLVKSLWEKGMPAFRSVVKLGDIAVPDFNGASLVDPERVDDPFLRRLVSTMSFANGEGVILVSRGVPPASCVGDERVTVLRPAQLLRDMFGGYFLKTVSVSLWVTVLILPLLVVLFGKMFPRIFLPVAFAVIATLGTLGWLGISIDFFQAITLFLIVGLGFDYAIFSANGSNGVVGRVVFASFLTSLTGFGLLAFTSFAVTRAMGVTLAFGLFYAYFFSYAMTAIDRRDIGNV